MKTIVGTAFIALGPGCQKNEKTVSRPANPEQRVTILSANTILESNPKEQFTNSRAISFNFYSDATDAKFVCQFGTEEGHYCVPPVTYTNLPDGRYGFFVRATSKLRGDDPVGATHFWTVDTVPPTTSLAATLNGHDSIIFTFDGNEPSCTFQCSIDGAQPYTCAPPLTVQGLSPGKHHFKVQAIDRAANIDPIGADNDFELRPVITTRITRVAPQVFYSNSNAIEFDFVSNISNAAFQCSMNSSTPVSCTPTHKYNGLPDGPYDFVVQAIDSYGYKDPYGSSYAWIVDTTPPTGNYKRLDSTSTMITVEWTTNEPTTTKVFWGLDKDLSRQTPEDTNLSLNHKVVLTGLSSLTRYSVQPAGADRATNGFSLVSKSISTKR